MKNYNCKRTRHYSLTAHTLKLKEMFAESALKVIEDFDWALRRERLPRGK